MGKKDIFKFISGRWNGAKKIDFKKKVGQAEGSTCSKSNMSNEANFEKRSYQLVGLDRVLTLLNSRKYQFCLQKLT